MKTGTQLRGYNKGYAQGYQAGLADGLAGKRPGDSWQELHSLPLEYLDLSVRARNCLTGWGCISVADVAALPEDAIVRMRGLGKRTADEIARALAAQNIRHTAWDSYLLD